MVVGNKSAELKAGTAVARTKQRYMQPILTRYGTVKTLTATGTSKQPENNPNCASKDNPHFGCQASDRSIKENILYVGRHPLGFGLYLFEYKSSYQKEWGTGRQFGVMADEVERAMPEAVSVHADGYKLVDYAMLGISRTLQ